MREMILKAVANPPKILWGPFLPVLLNMGVQAPFMFITIALFNVNPLIFLTSVVLVHTGIIFVGAREPHISSMIQAFGQTRRVSRNLYKDKGNKFAP